MSKLVLSNKGRKTSLDSGNMFTTISKMFKCPIVSQAMLLGGGYEACESQQLYAISAPFSSEIDAIIQSQLNIPFKTRVIS